MFWVDERASWRFRELLPDTIEIETKDRTFQEIDRFKQNKSNV